MLRPGRSRSKARDTAAHKRQARFAIDDPTRREFRARLSIFQLIHFSPNLVQSLWSHVMVHVSVVAAFLVIPVHLICNMDRLQLLPQDRELGLTRNVIIHDHKLRQRVTIRATLG
jgi:hypothetical protein